MIGCFPLPGKENDSLTWRAGRGMFRQPTNLVQERRNDMPVITLDTAALTREKKEQLVQSLTREASEITGIPREKFIVLINELDRDNIGVGGQLLSKILG